MNFKLPNKLSIIVFIIVITMLAACTSATNTQENADTNQPEEGSSSPAMVDNVTVEKRDKHDYAIINGNYPDACSHISSVEQVVEGSTIKITLLTKRPEEIMCATMLTPFTISVLLTTGGLMPQEYIVSINEGPSTTFKLEY